jgi:hypothetical protein
MRRKISFLVMGLVVMLTLVLVGCNQTASTISVGAAKDITTSLTYVKDARSNQCFAVVASRHVAQVSQNGFTITWVPCAPEVEALIGK